MQFLTQSFIVFLFWSSITSVISEDTTTTPKPEAKPIKAVYTGVRQVLGYSAVLKCIIFNKNATDIHWTRKGAQVKGDERHTVVRSANSTARSTSLKIKSIESADYGNYECHANISGTVYSTVIKLLRKKQAPVVRTHQTTIKESLNSNASLKCLLPKHAASINWIKNGTQVKTDKRHEVIRSSTDKFRTTTLNIILIEESDFGTYECTANVTGKIESANITLVQKKKNPIVKAFEHEYKEPLNAKAVLKCHISKPPNSTHWFKDGTKLKQDKRHLFAKFIKSGKVTSMSLTIEHLEASDYGNYECEAVISGKKHTANIKLVEKKSDR